MEEVCLTCVMYMYMYMPVSNLLFMKTISTFSNSYHPFMFFMAVDVQ